MFDTADGMYYLASAGMEVNEIMGAMKGTLDLAAATASDLAYTSESVAATLSTILKILFIVADSPIT